MSSNKKAKSSTSSSSPKRAPAEAPKVADEEKQNSSQFKEMQEQTAKANRRGSQGVIVWTRKQTQEFHTNVVHNSGSHEMGFTGQVALSILAAVVLINLAIVCLLWFVYGVIYLCQFVYETKKYYGLSEHNEFVYLLTFGLLAFLNAQIQAFFVMLHKWRRTDELKKEYPDMSYEKLLEKYEAQKFCHVADFATRKADGLTEEDEGIRGAAFKKFLFDFRWKNQGTGLWNVISTGLLIWATVWFHSINAQTDHWLHRVNFYWWLNIVVILAWVGFGLQSVIYALSLIYLDDQAKSKRLHGTHVMGYGTIQSA